MEYYQYEEASRKLIIKAESLKNAVLECITEYQERISRDDVLNLEVRRKMSEVSSMGIWAFKGYYTGFSLSKYISGKLNNAQGLDAEAGNPAPRVSESTITACCAPIDLPIACIAGALGAGVKLTENVVKIAGESVIHYYQQQKNHHGDIITKRPQIGVLQLASYKIQQVLDKKPVNVKELSFICHHVLLDLTKIVTASSMTSVMIGEGYVVEPLCYYGLRHYVSGKSRLADLIEGKVVWQFNFESEMNNFMNPNPVQPVRPPEISLNDNSAPAFERSSRYLYPAFQFSGNAYTIVPAPRAESKDTVQNSNTLLI